jgi:hypothetical protein
VVVGIHDWEKRIAERLSVLNAISDTPMLSDVEDIVMLEVVLVAVDMSIAKETKSDFYQGARRDER